jgi:hypothetical protein
MEERKGKKGKEERREVPSFARRQVIACASAHAYTTAMSSVTGKASVCTRILR